MVLNEQSVKTYKEVVSKCYMDALLDKADPECNRVLASSSLSSTDKITALFNYKHFDSVEFKKRL